MRLHRFIAALPALAAFAAADAATPAIPRDEAIEAKVQKTLARMTLDEKIGQMTEMTLDICGSFDDKGNFIVDEKRLDEIIGKYKVGSILNAPGTTAQTPQAWERIIGAIQRKSMATMGIPCIYGLDQNHGTTYTVGGTLFPQNINVAATFDTGLARRAGEITAYETRASATPWTYSPTLDLGRDPRWPRMWENFGEDALMNAEMGAAMVRGFQGDDPNHIGPDHIAACLKHYMGYGAPFSGKDRTPAIISASDLREKHFAPYLAAARAGALSVMVNSASVNGVPVHASHELLTEWLKEGLDWDGMIVTDWADINNLYTRERIAADKKDAIRIAINAGIDMAMEPYSLDYCTLLKELVEEGKVPMSRIDDATARVLRMKYRLGLFDRPMTVIAEYPEFASPEHAAAALQAAEESMVLLKNEDATLPLAKGTKILLTGPNADTMRGLDGGWSYSWQGHIADEFAASYNTILEAMQHKFGSANIIYEPGVVYDDHGNWQQEDASGIDKAVAAAGAADVIVACIGENSYCETPGNISDLNISRNQLELVRRLEATGKPVVVVLNEGRPRIIADIVPDAKAVVDIMLPGNYGGDALANLLAGDANFSGKLPFTYPKEINSLSTYDYKVSEEVDKMEGNYDYNAVVSVQWAFGYGLSYTTFAYSNLRVDKAEFGPYDTITVSVDVTNTGKRAGKESVLLFSSDKVASLVPDSRRLRAFEKIELAPGQTRTVTFTLPASELAFVGADGKWVLEQGEFRLQAGTEAVDVVCTATRRWDTPNR
ncbi:MAG: glycoside hydrolase family 3 C-terminal domain-containing protein [Muribaculaceae bacterium]|nr:glycoside hydrolase family 3 C-terminal domain-containing protein [Muribaculaceae bacterium]